jgi:hypothetical protein
MVSASRVVANGWMEGSMVVSVAGQRCSLIKGILTYVIATHRRTLMREVEERKKSIKLINHNLEQNNRRGEVITQRYSVVKLPHAEPGYTELNSLVKGRDKGEEVDIRLEQRTNE